MVCDALPPVTFDLGRPGWAPTLELTVHVRAVPAPGWLKVSHRTRNVAGGMFEEDCEVWDSVGASRRPESAAGDATAGLTYESNHFRSIDTIHRRRGCSVTDQMRSVDGQ